MMAMEKSETLNVIETLTCRRRALRSRTVRYPSLYVLHILSNRHDMFQRRVSGEEPTVGGQRTEGCDVVAGDITITSNRTEYADFTIPYMSSEIYMLVLGVRKWNQTILTLVKPFTRTLWIAIFSACILTVGAIGILEYRVENPDFVNLPSYQTLFMILWFPISKFFFQEGEIRNKCSKGVFLVWVTTIFIVMQIFTACLSSWLTINQLQPKVPKEFQVVGYQDGSYVVDFVDDHVQHSWITKKSLPLSSLDDYKNALDNETVAAIFYEHPYIDLILAKYGDIYMKVGPMADEPGLGFAFPRESPLPLNFSNAIVKVTEGPDMSYMKRKYLGIQTPLTTQLADQTFPQSLDVKSFSLLFLFMGVSTIMAIIISEFS